jgi:hypothetical protein
MKVTVGVRPAASLGAVLIVMLAFLAAQGAASHAADPGGGCDSANNSPFCTVTATGPDGSGNNGGNEGTAVGGGASGGGVQLTGCTNVDPEHGCDPCPGNGTMPQNPGVCQTWAHNLFCSELNPTGLSAADWQSELRVFGCVANTFVRVNLPVLAQRALGTIRFPHPSGDRSPRLTLLYRGYPFTYVNLYTFFWTSGSSWRTLSATASAGGVSATVTARPVELVFDPGDGGAAVSCGGPGRPWMPADGNGAPTSAACAYRYVRVTRSPITSTQTIVWRITWIGTRGAGGEIPSLSTSTSGRLQVLQIQVVNR